MTLDLTAEEVAVIRAALGVYAGPRVAAVRAADGPGDALNADPTITRWRTEAAVASDLMGRLP